MDQFYWDVFNKSFFFSAEENDTTICGAGSRKCMEEAKRTYTNLFVIELIFF